MKKIRNRLSQRTKSNKEGGKGLRKTLWKRGKENKLNNGKRKKKGKEKQRSEEEDR